jgi:hypothetical protein
MQSPGNRRLCYDVEVRNLETIGCHSYSNDDIDGSHHFTVLLSRSYEAALLRTMVLSEQSLRSPGLPLYTVYVLRVESPVCAIGLYTVYPIAVSYLQIQIC